MALPAEQCQRLMFSEAERLRTYGSWLIRDVMSPEELASAGFYYTGVHDRVQCAFCRGILRNWERGDNAMNEHRIHFSSCRYARGLDCGNVSLQSTLSGAALASSAIVTGSELLNQIDGCESLPGVSTSKPKHPQHAAEVHRLQTFRSWPTWALQSPDRLAKAGFFYVGSADYVRCFFCDGGLRNWDASSDPWEEHARCFPNCEYIARLQGTAFVSSIQRKHAMSPSADVQSKEAHYVNSSTFSTKAEGTKETVGRREHCSVQLLLRLGYARTLIQSVLDTHFPQYASGIYPSSAELLKVALATIAGNENPADACSDVLARLGASPAAITASSRVAPDADGSEAADSDRCSTNHSNAHEGVAEISAACSSTAAAYLLQEQPLRGGSDTAGIIGNGDADEIVKLRKYVECKICSRQRAEFLLLPCGHLGLCSDCVSSVRTCPACSTVVRGSLRVFLC